MNWFQVRNFFWGVPKTKLYDTRYCSAPEYACVEIAVAMIFLRSSVKLKIDKQMAYDTRALSIVPELFIYRELGFTVDQISFYRLEHNIPSLISYYKIKDGKLRSIIRKLNS